MQRLCFNLIYNLSEVFPSVYTEILEELALVNGFGKSFHEMGIIRIFQNIACHHK